MNKCFDIALSLLFRSRLRRSLSLVGHYGSAEEAWRHLNEPGMNEALVQAEREWNWINAHGIRVWTLTDEDYPYRLRQCPDRPLVLYSKGNVHPSDGHIVSIVGTRRPTERGKELTNAFVRDLAARLDSLTIVSGGAYGIDIAAHRAALQYGVPTIIIPAHGLDRIYPYRHRPEAIASLERGGILTEFSSGTEPIASNFVQRNRIVAGMADATILIESGAKGGGLITADIAQSYARAVFAFPGNVGQPYSEGCNNLIRDNGAGLISNAEDFVKAMGWLDETRLQQAFADGIERNLFPDLSPEEQTIVSLLQQTNDLQLNIITVKTGIPIGRLTALLFQLEMKGVVKPLAGGIYHLLL